MKMLLWALLIFGAVMWLMHGKKSRIKEQAGKRHEAPFSGTEAMVRCVHCGLYVPASEALQDAAGAQFCSEEHRRLQRPA